MPGAERWSASFRNAAPGRGMAPDEANIVFRLFEPWAELLLDRLDLEPGLAVLDVACGPGTVARLAAARVGPYGTVTACDISPAMLAMAASKAPVGGGAAIEYVECPADALRVADRAFDVITCQQGLQFFPDRAAALEEMRRAGRPGARVGLAVWATIEESPAFAALSRAIEHVLGPEVAATFRGGPWAFPDRSALQELAVAAGLVDVEVHREVLPSTFEGGAAQLVGMLAISAVGAPVAALDESGRASLLRAAEVELEPFTIDGQVRSDNASHILLATV